MAIKRKIRRPQKLHCLLPSLHGAVSDLLEKDDLYFGFHGKDDPTGCVIHQHTTFKGTFVCRNDTCRNDACRRKRKHMWKSAKIAITIRIYPGAEYNVRLYKQRCKHCNDLGDLIMDREGSYADTVACQIKQWYGLDAVPRKIRTRTGPHHRDRCEGCKTGHCQQGQEG